MDVTNTIFVARDWIRYCHTSQTFGDLLLLVVVIIIIVVVVVVVVVIVVKNRICGLLVRVPGYRSRGPGFDFRRYQIFLEVVGLELSLMSTIEDLLGRKSSGSGLEYREYGSRDPSRWPRGTLYPQKLALTSLTSGGRSVGIVPSRTQASISTIFIRNAVALSSLLQWFVL
jgi:hypothetical protein